MKPAVTVRRFTAAEFLAAAEHSLCEREAENNLILGLARDLAHQEPDPRLPPYFAAAFRDRTIVGAGFRTVSGKLGFTRLTDREVLEALATDALDAVSDAVAVLAPEPTAREAAAWVAERFGGVPLLRMSQRIHRLDAVVELPGLPEGRLRPAGVGDAGLLTPWLGEMLQSIGDSHDAGEVVRDRIAREQLFVWDRGGAVSMAAWTARTRNGVRVNYVFTPEAERGRGYATACVAGLTRYLLGRGSRFCCLYTDLANPTSNAIYARIGYHPVCDAGYYSVRQG